MRCCLQWTKLNLILEFLIVSLYVQPTNVSLKRAKSKRFQEEKLKARKCLTRAVGKIQVIASCQYSCHTDNFID